MNTSFCRLCMQEHITSISMFGTHRGMRVSDLIRRFIPELKIDESENLSKYICENCFNVLANADELRRSSIDNDRIQRDAIEDSKPVNIKIEIIEDFVYENDEKYVDEPDEDIFDEHAVKSHSIDLKRLPETNSSIKRENEVDRRCKERGKVLSSSRSIKSNFLVDHERNIKLEPIIKRTVENRTCKICFKVFTRPYHMQRHVKDVHKKGTKKSKKVVKDMNETSLENRTCTECGKVLSRPYRLIHHLRVFHNITTSKFYECDLCFMAFKQRAKLEEHIIVDHLKNKINFSSFSQCVKCHKSFIDKNDLASHQFYVHGIESVEGSYSCDQCGKGFKIKAQLQEHLNVKHLQIQEAAGDNLKFFECRTCFTSYLDFDELHTHSIFTHNKAAYKNDCLRNSSKNKTIKSSIKKEDMSYDCPECGRTFTDKKDLTLHIQIHSDFVRKLTDEETSMMIFKCIICPLQFEQESFLQLHLQYHLDYFTSEKLILCGCCNTILKDYDFFVSHSAMHNEKITHECLKCQKKFAYGRKFLNHIQTHKQNEKQRCTYENCNFKCRDEKVMNDHVRHRHLNEMSNLCADCGKTFATRKSLKSHVRKIHENKAKQYQCSSCPRSFDSLTLYRSHQAVHTTEYNFKCDHPGCNKVFKALRNLKRHRIHHDETKHYKKFGCEYCEMKFYTKDHARKHTYSHTGERPYACTFEGCDRAFAQSNDLNKHLRTHYQQEETYFCSYLNCKQSFKFLNDLRYHEGLHYQNRDPTSKEIILKNKFYGRDD